MKLATYERRGHVAFGAIVGERVIDLSGEFPDLVSLLAGGAAAFDVALRAVAAAQQSWPISEIAWLPPIPRPGKVICVGLNYRSHLALLDDPMPEYPVLFSKPTTSLVGSGRAIMLPCVTGQVDYEGELAVVMGTRGKYIAERDALAHVGGYTCANDVSAHDIEFRTSQWTSGKMLDTFCPMGPTIATADEVPHPNNLRLQTMLNDEVVQDESTSDMVFSVPQLISYISSLATLEPGDVILTGTPAGLGCMRNPQVFLRPGDRVTVAIERIGVLTSPVTAEA
jgi:2-keto-4-pentenoate hydratase/2-oxohepta-3-ene-1,7-dioic acid hydratase in catechol pathway